MNVPKLEKSVGIEVYSTHSSGIGGLIRKDVEDFIVEEVLVDGSKAEIEKTKDLNEQRVLGSSQKKGHYLLCTLVKRNWDTFLALRQVAAQLGARTGQIQIAGIKDAKALTGQFVTVEGISTDDLEQVRVRDIEVSPVGYLHHKLSSFYLFGNNFQIFIKEIDNTKSTVQKRIKKTIEEIETIGGIANFFGHQRFGTTRPITHRVGKAMVNGNYEKAAMLFLADPSANEHPASRKARKQLQTSKDFNKAYENFPKQLRYERLMLRHLAQKPDDFINAFRKLPIKLRMLFTQAYQSYLFNRFLSKRMSNGLQLNKAEVGDYAVNVDHSGLPMPMMAKKVDSTTTMEINKHLKTGKMRLAIPLIGFKQHPSEGIQGEIERQILEEERVAAENFKTIAMPEASNRGELRAILAPVKDFSLEQITCNQSSKCKVKIVFTLQRGSYATVLLRELMKTRNPIRAGF